MPSLVAIENRIEGGGCGSGQASCMCRWQQLSAVSNSPPPPSLPLSIEREREGARQADPSEQATHIHSNNARTRSNHFKQSYQSHNQPAASQQPSEATTENLIQSREVKKTPSENLLQI